VQTEGMSEATILADEQIVMSSVLATGSIRPSGSRPLSTFESSINVTIQLTNDNYPFPPQLGKVNILDDVSANVGSYAVYYRKVSVSIAISR